MTVGTSSGHRMNRDLETARTLALVAVILNVIGFFIGLITIVLAVLPLLWLILDLVMVYTPLGGDRPESAETPALVLGILQLITLDIVSGILLLIAWVKIRDGLSRAEAETPGTFGDT